MLTENVRFIQTNEQQHEARTWDFKVVYERAERGGF